MHSAEISGEDGLKNKEDLEKLKEYYENNKRSLEKIDKILDSLVAENKGVHKVFSADDITDIINIIIKNEAKKKSILFKTNIAIKSSKYITGNINQAIFITCELLKKVIKTATDLKELEFTLTEDENNWIINISAMDNLVLNTKDVFFLKRVVSTIEDINIEFLNNKIDIYVTKK